MPDLANEYNMGQQQAGGTEPVNDVCVASNRT